jgi:hypothetical protein
LKSINECFVAQPQEWLFDLFITELAEHAFPCPSLHSHGENIAASVIRIMLSWDRPLLVMRVTTCLLIGPSAVKL